MDQRRILEELIKLWCGTQWESSSRGRDSWSLSRAWPQIHRGHRCSSGLKLEISLDSRPNNGPIRAWRNWLTPLYQRSAIFIRIESTGQFHHSRSNVIVSFFPVSLFLSLSQFFASFIQSGAHPRGLMETVRIVVMVILWESLVSISTRVELCSTYMYTGLIYSRVIRLVHRF